MTAPSNWTEIMGAEDPQVIQTKGLAMQVCVPASWGDVRIIDFAERKNPCGTEHGWQIKEGDGLFPKHVPCIAREGYVHVVLEA
jgi:hypothetical protein